MVAIYLFENIIQYKEKEEIKEFIMPKKAMEYGKIKNIPMFEEYVSKLIKQEKTEDALLLSARRVQERWNRQRWRTVS